MNELAFRGNIENYSFIAGPQFRQDRVMENCSCYTDQFEVSIRMFNLFTITIGMGIRFQ